MNATTLSDPFFKFLPYSHASLLAGLVWGQKSSLLPEQYEWFKTTGLLHLLVLSGQNITLLTGFVAILLKRISVNRYVSKLGVVAVALFYLVLFYKEPSIVRASIMALMVVVSDILETNTISTFLLIITAGIMLAIKPAWITSVSFWLSVSATLGILALYPKLKERSNSPIYQAFALSLSAQLFTTPILLFVFREITLLAIPMNMAIAFLVEPIMVIGILLSTLGPLCKPVGLMLGFILYGLLGLLLQVVRIGHSISPLFIIRI